MKGFKILIVFCFCASLLSSCRSDKPKASVPGSLVSGSHRVWVCNEGNFQQGNSELGIYNRDKLEYSSKVFAVANGTSPGDVLQSIYFYNSLAYLVLNNSGKIGIVDTSNFSMLKEISGFDSPRYMLQVAPSKAYVSDLYADAVSVLDLDKDSILNSIPCGDWTDKMLQYQNKVFVTMPLHDQLYILDAVTDQVLDSISVSFGSNSLVLDENQILWVLCSGSGSENRPGGLYKIDPISHNILNQWSLSESKLPSHLAIDEDGQNLYFLYEDLLKMNISDPNIPSSSFFPANGKVFYGMNIDKNRNEIYLANAKDFVQKGEAIRLDSSGVLISTFATGINPNGFYFE